MARWKDFIGSIFIGSGMKPKGDYPLMDAHDIVTESGMRLDAKLEELAKNAGGAIVVDKLPTENINKNTLYIYNGDLYTWVEEVNTWQFKESGIVCRTMSVSCTGRLYNQLTDSYDEFSEFVVYQFESRGSIYVVDSKTGEALTLYYSSGSSSYFLEAYRDTRKVTFDGQLPDEFITWLNDNATIVSGYFKKVSYSATVSYDSTSQSITIK